MKIGSKRLLWLVAFGYGALAAVAIQLVLLPLVFPQWHYGNGLLVGGDWTGFHREAVELSARIASEGWGVWELDYFGHPVSGMLAAIYAMIGVFPILFSLIAAALHATSFVLVVSIIQRFVPSARRSVLAGLPFLLFPTSLLWTVMPLKDGFSICGFLLLAYAWVIVVDLASGDRARWGRALRGILCFASGAVLLWAVRGYLLILYLVLGAAISVGISIWALVASWRKSGNRRGAQIAVLVMLVGLLVPMYLPAEAPTREWETLSRESDDLSDQTDVEAQENPIYQWRETRWLPSGVDSFMHILSRQREHSRRGYPHASSNIDEDVALESAGEIIAYLPRALQIALFAPFPSHWTRHGIGDGVSAGDLMWLMATIEMAISYLVFPFLLIGCWKWRRRTELWILVLLCTAGLLIHPLFVANLGTLVRLRYPYFLVLVCLGLASALEHGPSIARRIRELVIR